MKWVKRGILALAIMIWVPLTVPAEEISNYSGCDVCHGTIHLTIQETKNLLGIEGMMAMLKMPVSTDRQIKIDLDGQLANGDKDTPDDGYEIKIWGSDVFYIKDLRDLSFIQVITARSTLSSGDNMQNYQPHIYLGAGSDHEIALEDSVDVGWEKLKNTRIYQWVGKTDDKQAWLRLLRGKIFEAMDLMVRQD